jgi:hypothetical protein
MPTLDLSRRLGAANGLKNDLVGFRRYRAGSARDYLLKILSAREDSRR